MLEKNVFEIVQEKQDGFKNYVFGEKIEIQINKYEEQGWLMIKEM